MVEIEYFFSHEDDYYDYPRFRDTARIVISARVHRDMPLREHYDDRYLPLFIFERQSERSSSSKRGYVNVNKRYHAYMVEDGEIKHVTFKTYKTFIKVLKLELDKTRVENELTKVSLIFSNYEKNIPAITLYPLYFSDETELIERIIKIKVEDEIRKTDIYNEVEKIRDAIRVTNEQIKSLDQEIKDINEDPVLAISPDARRELNYIISVIKTTHTKFYCYHRNLSQIREDFYGILKERRKLSAKKWDTIHTILYATEPAYRELWTQKNGLEELINNMVEKGGDKIKEEIMAREERINKLQERSTVLWSKYNELGKKKDAKYSEIEDRIRAEMEKSIIF
jgi:hypothetical protein